MNNDPVKFLLNWNRFNDHLISCMNKLLTDSSYSDIIIATADKQMIYSHRFVLANSSKYFQRVLRRINPHKGAQLVVALPEIKYDIFKILMNYMYKGVSQVPHELLPSVIKAGQFLEINGLMNISESENESENGLTKVSNPLKVVPADPTEPKPAMLLPSARKTPITKEANKLFGPIPQNLLTKIGGRENNSVGPKNPLQIEANKTKKPNDVVNNHSGDTVKTVETGKENENKLAKPTANKASNEEKSEVIQLPLKRKTCMKEPIKKVPPLIISKSPTSTPSSSSASSFVVVDSLPPPKKRREIILDAEDHYEEVVITTEKKKPENTSAEKENQEVHDVPDIQEIQEVQEIYPNKQDSQEPQKPQKSQKSPKSPKSQKPQKNQKTQKPQKPQETQKSQEPPRSVTKTVNIYSELKCEFCHKGFTKPTDWAKHMASKHADKGFKYFKDMQRVAEKGPITCIMCSYVFVSRDEYVKHINRELCCPPEKKKINDGKVIKKIGINEKK